VSGDDSALTAATPQPASRTTVTALVVVQNGEARLARGIASILDQTAPVDHLVIVSDHSTDRTVEVADSFPEATVVTNEGFPGIAAARNRGLREIEDDWVAFLDHDDI